MRIGFNTLQQRISTAVQLALLAAVAALVLTPAHLAAQPILPPPPVPVGNPQTLAKILLGKALFWDEQLSSTRTVACGTCHVLAHGGTDPRAVAVDPGRDGIVGTDDDVHGSSGVVRHDRAAGFLYDPVFGLQPQVTSRKAPSVLNAAYAAALFGDGRATEVFRDPTTGVEVLAKNAALESQAVAPLLNDREMAHVGRAWSDVIGDLPALTPLALASNVPSSLAQFVAGQTYASLFQQAFGTTGITAARVAFAIAAYERTLVSDQSPYDLYLAGRGTLTPAQARGLTKFDQFCVECHADISPAVLVTGPVNEAYRNIGVRPVAEDTGRFAVTNNPLDRGRFRVPGLRNVALRAPFFHNGGPASLGEVIDFYARGGDFPDNRDPLLARIPGHIDNVDRVTLERFLEALTDPRVANELPPFDRPTLWSEGSHVPARLGRGTGPVGGVAPRASFNMPAFGGNVGFGVGVDRAAAGVPVALIVDLVGGATPTPVFGLDVYLGLSPALVALGLARPTIGAGPTDGRASLGIPVPAAGLAGSVVFGQWILADPRGPQGLTCSEALRIPIF